MTSSIVIAAVTQTLAGRLKTLLNTDSIMPSRVDVTVLPPDKLKDSEQNNLNLFLYQVLPNAAWRNMVPPTQVRPGETGNPPLALILNYLITAYGTRGEEQSHGISHRILGRAMSILHDNPLITKNELQGALGQNEKDKLGELVEPIRITHLPISTEEMSKIWTIFQVGYRVSAAYQVSVVMIDSVVQAKSPLPVLKRGEDDTGVSSVVSMPPFIDGINVSNLPKGLKLSGSLKDELEITGENLDGGDMKILFSSPYLTDDISLLPFPDRSGDTIRVKLPDPQAYDVLTTWHPGTYGVSLQIAHPNLGNWITNQIPFSLAPAITVGAKDPRNPLYEGTIELNLTCTPYIRKTQRVMVIFGDRQISVPQVPDPPAKPRINEEPKPMELSLTIPNVLPKTYVFRLRVDGVDSIPLPPRDPTKPLSLQFDPKQMVKVEKKP